MNIICRKPPERIRQNKHFTGGYMTKKEFKEAMIRGLGRCVMAVRQDPEKYREFVLWACTRNIAYDAQSEGTRAWYVYTMASSYSDRETFIDAVAEALKNYRPGGGWDLNHLSELLMYFAQDGYEFARQAVEDKYGEILSALHGRKCRPNGVFHEITNLEELALVLSVDRTSFLRFAKDFGRLYREKAYLYDGEFSWFFESQGRRYRKAMEQAARKDEDIAAFFQREQADIDAQEEQWEQNKANPQERLSGVPLSRWLERKADKEPVERYALAYREQTDPDLRAEALKAFSCCPYPDDPRPIIEDAQSDYEELQNTAWRALKNIRHPAVRAFAINHAKTGICTPENFALLVTNYVPKDAVLLEELLRERIVAKDRDDVHAAGMNIYRAFYKDSGIPHPKHLLPLLYEYNPCSYCRECAIAYMSKHRMLTKELLRECLYDSNDDIRRMAAKRLK